MKRGARFRPKTPPERLADVLHRWLDRNTEGKKITQYTIHERWPELVGERLASRTSPRSLRTGVLVVAVASSAWLNELSFMRADLVRQINAGLGKHLVSGIRLLSGKVDPPEEKKPPPQVEELEDVPLHMVEKIERQTAQISDPELRQAILGARLAELKRAKRRAQLGTHDVED